jgi:hypothetical protein
MAPATVPACIVAATRVSSLSSDFDSVPVFRTLAIAAAFWSDGGVRDAEVHDDGFGVAAQHDVGGLEIAMHHAGVVRGLEPRGHLPRNGHDAGHLQAAPTSG